MRSVGRLAGAHLDVRRLLLQDEVGHLLGNLAKMKKPREQDLGFDFLSRRGETISRAVIISNLN